MKFAYIGLKADGERAFMERTGIEWMPGSEHDVTDAEAAAEMLKHPTVWKQLEGGSVPVPGETKAQYPRAGAVTDEDVDEEMDRQEKARKEAADAAAATASADAATLAAAQAAQDVKQKNEPEHEQAAPEQEAKPARPAKKTAAKKSAKKK